MEAAAPSADIERGFELAVVPIEAAHAVVDGAELVDVAGGLSRRLRLKQLRNAPRIRPSVNRPSAHRCRTIGLDRLSARGARVRKSALEQPLFFGERRAVRSSPMPTSAARYRRRRSGVRRSERLLEVRQRLGELAARLSSNRPSSTRRARDGVAVARLETREFDRTAAIGGSAAHAPASQAVARSAAHRPVVQERHADPIRACGVPGWSARATTVVTKSPRRRSRLRRAQAQPSAARTASTFAGPQAIWQARLDRLRVAERLQPRLRRGDDCPSVPRQSRETRPRRRQTPDRRMPARAASWSTRRSQSLRKSRATP